MVRVKLGDVEFSVVESEKPRDLATITDHPVEKGQDISDHVKQDPSIIDLYGQMVGPDAAKKLSQLKKYQREGELLNYVGRNSYTNVVIQSIDRDHSVRNRFGYEFNMTLKHVRIAVAKTVEVKGIQAKPKAKVETKVKPKTSNGTQQTKSKTTSKAPASKATTTMSKAKPPYKQESVQDYVRRKKNETPTQKLKGLADTFGVPPRPKPGYIHSDSISAMPGSNWVRVK